jgi:hypothetical protein
MKVTLTGAAGFVGTRRRLQPARDPRAASGRALDQHRPDLRLSPIRPVDRPRRPDHYLFPAVDRPAPDTRPDPHPAPRRALTNVTPSSPTTFRRKDLTTAFHVVQLPLK